VVAVMALNGLMISSPTGIVLFDLWLKNRVRCNFLNCV
jgi:hypothetical protein